MEDATPEELPSALDATCYGQFARIEADKVTARYIGHANHAHDVGCVRSNFPLPTRESYFYFEVTFSTTSASTKVSAGVGLIDPSYPLDRFPGTEPSPWSIAYKGTDGHMLTSVMGQGPSSKEYGPQFGAGDTVGCRINFESQEVVFTLNGTELSVACHLSDSPNPIYACIALHSKGATVNINFGTRPFLYDVNVAHAVANSAREKEISAACVDGSVMDKLVANYLLHRGCAATLESLSRSLGHGGAASIITGLGQRHPTADGTANGDSKCFTNGDGLHKQETRGGVNNGADMSVETEEQQAADPYRDDEAMFNDPRDRPPTPYAFNEGFHMAEQGRRASDEELHFSEGSLRFRPRSVSRSTPPTTVHINELVSTEPTWVHTLVDTLPGRCAAGEAVLSGNPDKAREHTSALAPGCLDTHTDVEFALRLEHFLGLIGRGEIMNRGEDVGALEYAQSMLSPYLLAGTTHSSSESNPESFPDSKPSTAKRSKLEHTASEKAIENQLLEAMGLLAYADPSQSPLAHLLTPGRRRDVGVHLNRAILDDLWTSKASAAPPPGPNSPRQDDKPTAPPSGLERIATQLLATKTLLRQVAGSRGSVFQLCK